MRRERLQVHLRFGNTVYTEDNCESIPFDRGIYMAFIGKFNGRYVELRKLLYIGMGDDTSISDRIRDHALKDHESWLKQSCEPEERVYYRVANMEENIRQIEATLIYKHKPEFNTQDKDKYNGIRPAPDITTDLAIEDVCGEVIDMLALL